MTSSNQRSDQPPDPFQYWRDLYQQTEATWGKLLEQNMGTEAYAAMIGQQLEAYSNFQKAMRDSMSRYLETMNLPSREDFSRVAAQIVALEAKVDALDEKLDQLQDGLAQRGELFKELRASLRSQDEKLVDLAERLEARDQRVGEMLDRFVAGQRGSSPSRQKSE